MIEINNLHIRILSKDIECKIQLLKQSVPIKNLFIPTINIGVQEGFVVKFLESAPVIGYFIIC